MAAGEPARGPDSQPKPFGIFMLARIRFRIRRVQEKAPAPQRLVCMHLQSSSPSHIGSKKKSNSHPARRQRKSTRSYVKRSRVDSAPRCARRKEELIHGKAGEDQRKS